METPRRLPTGYLPPEETVTGGHTQVLPLGAAPAHVTYTQLYKQLCVVRGVSREALGAGVFRIS